MQWQERHARRSLAMHPACKYRGESLLNSRFVLWQVRVHTICWRPCMQRAVTGSVRRAEQGNHLHPHFTQDPEPAESIRCWFCAC